MDGEFSTRTLQQSPSVQGFLTINNFSLNNQMVGDLSLSSSLIRAKTGLILKFPCLLISLVSGLF